GVLCDALHLIRSYNGSSDSWMSTAPSWLVNGFSSGAFCGGCVPLVCPPGVFVPFWLLCPCAPLFEPLESRNSTLEAFTFVISRLLPFLSWNLLYLRVPFISLFFLFVQYCFFLF